MKKFTTFLILILLVAALVWWRHLHESTSPGRIGSFSPPPELVPFRTAGGTLHANGFLKTETLQKETGSWLGTTSSSIRLNATYRYDIELRSRWNIYLDDTRHVAFVVAPVFGRNFPSPSIPRAWRNGRNPAGAGSTNGTTFALCAEKLRPTSKNWPGVTATARSHADRHELPSRSSYPTGCSSIGAGRSIPNAS